MNTEWIEPEPGDLLIGECTSWLEIGEFNLIYVSESGVVKLVKEQSDRGWYVFGRYLIPVNIDR